MSKAVKSIKEALHNWIDSLQGKQLIENIYQGKDISKEMRDLDDVVHSLCESYKTPSLGIDKIDEEISALTFNKADDIDTPEENDELEEENIENSSDDFNPQNIGKDSYDKTKLEENDEDEDSNIDFDEASKDELEEVAVTNDIVGHGPDIDLDKEQTGNKNSYKKSNDFENVGPAGRTEKGLHKIESSVKSVRYIETAAIKPSNYEWNVYNGKRKKKYKWGNKEWKLGPSGIVGISPKPDLRGRHSFVILDESKSQALELSEHEARLLKSRCTPFEGDIKALLSTSPNSGGRSVTASFSILNIAKKIGLTAKDLRGMSSNQFNFEPLEYLDTRIYGVEQLQDLFDGELVVSEVDENTFEYSGKNKKIAFRDAIKYFSNLFNAEPDQDLDETQPVVWETDDGSVTLRYAPPSKFVVSYKSK
jgi:hypothetical protein